jgi:thiol-disulfide isomerase/thioredoxin
MTRLARFMASLAFALTASAAAAAVDTVSVAGMWRAKAEVKGAAIPFRLDIRGQGDAVQATFFDGIRPTNASSEGSFHQGRLHLYFPSYAANLDATVVDGRLSGAYVTPIRSIAIEGQRGGGPTLSSAAAPSIGGEWIVPLKSDKGEAAWRLIVKQTGQTVEAAILRVDGDTGALVGHYSDGAFRLSHFAGERPGLLIVTPGRDHTLKLVLDDLDGERTFTAVRPVAAAKAGVAPTDPARHTTVQNKAEPFRFAFKDLNGKLVSNTDARFRRKVVVVDVMGSWCPNCHDEAAFLQALYAKHHKDGLEVVSLAFEQADQLPDPKRLRAFIARYGLTFTVLLAGEPKDVGAKLPQAVGLNAWPTTFFVGRDGLVKATHVGFTSPASGPRDSETRREVEQQVVALLAKG